MTPKQEYNKRYYEKNKEKIAKQRQQKHDPHKRRGWKLKYLYGISHEDYQKLLEKQKGICAICSSTFLSKGEKFFHVDHCHTTGTVRGLLCSHCNRGLGYFKDSSEILRKAIEYLNEE